MRLVLFIFACTQLVQAEPHATATRNSPVPGNHSRRLSAGDCCPQGTSGLNCIACVAGKYQSLNCKARDAGGCDNCPRGWLGVGTGNANCQACPVGKFSDGHGGDSRPLADAHNVCKLCPAAWRGRVDSDSSPTRTTCLKCYRGTFRATPGGSACTSCPSTFFQPELERTSCIVCPAGTYALAADRSSCVECEAGKYWANWNGSNTKCKNCPTFHFQGNAGHTKCKPCLRGHYLTSATTSATKCKWCPTSHYNTEDAQSSCIACPAGQYHQTTRASTPDHCIACPAGRFRDAGQCKDCPQGWYVEDGAADSSRCKECPYSYFQEEDTSRAFCATCPVGTYTTVTKTFWAEDCIACEREKYLANADYVSGPSKCKLCESGKWQYHTGQSTCKKCPPGYRGWTTLARDSCPNCPAGTYASGDELTTVCKNCPASHYQGQDQESKCKQCPAGKYHGQTALLALSCIACPAGRYLVAADYVSGPPECKRCPGNFEARHAEATACTLCRPGFHDVATRHECTACLPGTYRPTNNQSLLCNITSMEPGAVNKMGGVVVAASSLSSTGLLPATVGECQDSCSTMICDACPVSLLGKRYAFFAFESPLYQCKCGTSCPDDDIIESVCQACPAGFEANASASTACKPSAPTSSPTTAPTSSSPTTVPTSSPSSAVPTASPSSSPTTAPTTSPSSSPTVSCQPGTFGPHGGNCTRCAFGQYQDGSGSTTTCKVCGRGHWFNSTLLACAECPSGMFQDNVTLGLQAQRSALGGALASAAAAGKQWPPPSLSLVAAEDIRLVPDRACQVCPCGWSQTAPGQAKCVSSDVCVAGQGMDGTICKNCPVGTFSLTKSSYACDPCPEGEFQNATGKSQCERCVAGTHQNQTRQGACLKCVSGTHAPRPAMMDCDACIEGQYQSDAGKVECLACAVGKRQHDSGQSACLSCLPGTHAQRVGLSECFNCSQGTFADEAGAETCVGCDAGTFQNAEGTQACLRCLLGKHAQRGGMVECFNCSQGTFADELGTVSCKGCGAGTFQRTEGSQACGACPATFYGPTDAALTCLRCAGGRYQKSDGQTICKSCASGTFLDGDDCQACLAGTFAAFPDTTQCAECQGNTYVELRGSLICKQCAAFSRPTNTSSSCACGSDYFEVGMASVHSEPNATSSACRRIVVGSGGGITHTDGEAVTEFDAGCCLPCPDGAHCVDGFPLVRPGYWRKALPMSAAAQQKAALPIISMCRSTFACPGEVSKDADDEAATLEAPRGANMSASGPCGVGYEGRLCGRCEEGWKPAANDLICHDCSVGGKPYESSHTPLVLCLLALTLLLVVALAVFATSHRAEADSLMNEISDSDHGRNDASEVVEKLEVLVPYLQRLGSIAGVFIAIQWPPFVKNLLGLLRLFYVDIAFTFRLVSPCDLALTHLESLILALIMLPLLAACCVAAYALSAPLNKLRRRCCRGSHPAHGSSATAKTRLTAVLVMGGKLIVPGLGSRIGKSFVCTSNTDGEGSFLMVALDTRCWTTEHMVDQGGWLALFGAIVIVAGSLVALMVVVVDDRRHSFALARQRREDTNRALKLVLHRDDTMHRRAEERAKAVFHTKHLSADARLLARHHAVVDFLVDKYKPHAWWWFAAELCFTLVFVAFLMTLQAIPAAQLAAALLTCLVHALLLSSIKPHRDANDDQLALAGATGYFVCLVSGMVKLIHRHVSHHATPTRTLEMLNFLIAAVFVASLLGIVWILARAVAKSGRLALCCNATNIVSRACLGTRRSGRRRGKVQPVTSMDRGEAAKDSGSGQGIEMAQRGGNTTSSSTKQRRGPQRLDREELLVSLEALPLRILRLSPGLFSQCAPALQLEYVERVEQLYEVQTRCVAVALQAITRGGLARRSRPVFVTGPVSDGAEGRKGKGREKAHPHLQNFMAQDRQRQQLQLQLRRPSMRASTHRELHHTSEEVNTLVSKLHLAQRLRRNMSFGDGGDGANKVSPGGAEERKEDHQGGQADADGKSLEEASRGVLDLLRVQHWTHAELQGLHEQHRLSDADMVTLISLSHEKEHAEHGRALEQERQQQASAASVKRARRGLARAFTASRLGVETPESGAGAGAGAGAGTCSRMSQDVEEMFRRADMDADGIITGTELVALFRKQLGKELSLGRAHEILDAGDVYNDRNGFDVDDLRALLAAQAQKDRKRRSVFSGAGAGAGAAEARAGHLAKAGGPRSVAAVF